MRLNAKLKILESMPCVMVTLKKAMQVILVSALFRMKSARKSALTNITDSPSGYYLQLGAYQQIGNAQATQAEYALNWAHLLPSVEVVVADNYYRLFAGPFQSQEEADYAAQRIGTMGNRPLVVKR